MTQYTDEELKHWWPAKCPVCGWEGLSRDCAGGWATPAGDYDDPACPVCFEKGDFTVVDDQEDEP